MGGGFKYKQRDNFVNKHNGICMYCNIPIYTKYRLESLGFNIVRITTNKYKCMLNKVQTDFPIATIEHIIPRSYGGRDSRKNYGISCAKCNHKKKNFLNLGMLLFTEQGELDYADTR